MCTQPFVCFTTQPGTRTADSDGPLNCSSCNGFGVPGGKLSNLNPVKISVPSSHRPGTSGNHWIACALFSLLSNNQHQKHQDADLGPVASAARFPPCVLNFITAVQMVPDGHLDPSFDNLGLHKRSEDSHDAEKEMDGTSKKNNANRAPFFCGVGRNRVSCSPGWP